METLRLVFTNISLMAIGVIRIVSTRNVNGLFMRTNVKVVVKGIHRECQTRIFIFNQHKFLYFTIQF